MLRIEPLHPLFAARVSGIDLSEGVSNADFKEIRHAFERHSVLVFPGQRNDDTALAGDGPLLASGA
jgi:alpha-ketoglutarate-dependent 2,4-dichlorophenoxyacetate dioxygenase